MGKGVNAGYQHLPLLPQCFQKLSSSGLLKVMIVWERVNPEQTTKIQHQSKLIGSVDDILNVTKKLNFVLIWVENIQGKGENTCYKHFLLLPHCFLTFQKQIIFFVAR